MDAYTELFAALTEAKVRFVVIGVGGANYYLLPRQNAFLTEDRDLLLPLDPENTLRCWQLAESLGFELWTTIEPLGKPLDLWLAERVIERRAVVTGHRDAVNSRRLPNALAWWRPPRPAPRPTSECCHLPNRMRAACRRD